MIRYLRMTANQRAVISTILTSEHRVVSLRILMKDVSVTLASGDQYRVTSYQVDLHSPNGEILRQFDMRDIAGIGRAGTTVRIRERNGETFDVTTMSLDDARRIEAIIRTSLSSRGAQTVPLMVTPADAPTHSSISWKLMLIVIAITASCIAGVVIAVPLDEYDESTVNGNRRIVYTVTDSTDVAVSLTYQRADGEAIQLHVADTPWRKRLSARSGAELSVSAQRGAEPGTVHCEIRNGDILIDLAESTGAFATVTCHGNVP
jgi:hypothetical protein